MKTNLFRTKFLLTVLLLVFSNSTWAQSFLNGPPAENENPLELIYSSYEDLINNPDTTLQREKKFASRWMSYVLPYLEIENGQLTNSAFKNALKSAMGGSSECTNDPANWSSDGPVYIPDWTHGIEQQTSGGWVDGVYNNPINPDVILIGTRTSGIMRTANGGLNWECVTDNLDFPVLGMRAIAASPSNPNYIVVATGAHFIQGGVIYSADNGTTWNEVEQELPQFYWIEFHPSINGLIFATSDQYIYYSSDYGINWSVLGAPPAYDPLHTNLDKIIVLENSIYFNTDHHFNGLLSELYKGDLTITGNDVNATFTNDISQIILP